MLKSYFIDGDKGGVGKSLFTRAFVHYYMTLPKDKRPSLMVVDADLSNPDVCGKDGLASGGLVLAADLFDLSQEIGWIELANRIAKVMNSSQEIRLLVNLPAQIGPRAFDGALAIASEVLRDTNAIPVWLLNRSKDCVTALEFRHRALPHRYAVGAIVKNTYFGAAEKFWRWDSSALRKGIVREDGGGWIETALPELNDELTDAIGRRPFHEVYAQGLDGKPLPYGYKLALDAWFRAAAKQFARIEALAPSQDDADEDNEE